MAMPRRSPLALRVFLLLVLGSVIALALPSLGAASSAPPSDPEQTILALDGDVDLPAWILPDAIAERGITSRGLTFWQPRAFPIDEILPETVLNGYNAIVALDAQPDPPSAFGPSVVIDRWSSVGPSPMATCQIGVAFVAQQCTGRVTALAADPTDANHWLLGFANGGIWETTNAGATWATLADSASTLTVGAIAIAPSNPDIIYVGTGEANLSCDSYAGLGILKSTNGGTTWSIVGSTEFSGASIASVIVDPTDPDKLTVASTVGLAGSGCALPGTVPATGVFTSADGGTTWTATSLTGSSPRVRASDVRDQPGAFANQYAGIDSDGVYRSTDTGATWAKVPGPWDTLSRWVIKVAFAPSNPDTLYVTVANGGGGLRGLWRTDDALSPAPTWTQIDASGSAPGAGASAASLGFCGWNAPFSSAGSQCWYDMVIIVDPTNADTIYAGGISVYKYDGATWTEVAGYNTSSATGIHADIHAFAWAGARLLVGSDGGVWSLSDDGATRENHNNAPLSGQQFYDGVLHPTNGQQMLAGAQDNGTNRRTTSNSWDLTFGGDGATPIYSLTSPNTSWVAQTQNGNIRRTTDGGVIYGFAGTGISGSSPFIGKIEQCPNNENVVLTGRSSIFKTTNMFSAATASAVSWASTPNAGAFASLWRSFAFAKSDATCNTFAAGTGGATLRITVDGGATYRDLDAGNQVPARYISDLSFDPTNPAILYVVISGFDEGTPGTPGHVFKTTNATTTVGPVSWTNISPPASNHPFNTIQVDPTNPLIVYAGSDFGAWKSVDGGATWVHFTADDGFPNVSVYDIESNPTTNKVVAFTHGRGAYELIQDRYTIGLAKNATSVTYSGNGIFTVVYDLTVQNYGTFPLSNVQVVDDLATTFASASGFSVVSLTSPTLALNAGYTGIAPNTNLLAGTDSLNVGASATIQLTVSVTPGAVNGPYSNSATTTAEGPGPIPVSDISQSGTNANPDIDLDPTNNNQPTSVTFPAVVPVTFTTSPAGRGIVVGGTLHSTPTTVLLVVGSTVPVSTTSPQSGGPGSQFVFTGWSDSGAITHSYTVPGVASTLTANFKTQHQLITAASGDGTVLPPSGSFYDQGTIVGLSATAGPLSQFASWTGAVAAPLSPLTTVTMTGPQSVTANFTGIADLSLTKSNGLSQVNPGAPTTYTITVTNSGPGAANGTTLSDPAAAGLLKVAVGPCVPGGGAACPPLGFNPGDLSIANLEAGTVAVPLLPAGGSVSISVVAVVTVGSGTVTNTASATTPPGIPDPTPATASDTDRVVDTMPPVVTLSGPVNGGSYLLGAVPTPVCTTSDPPPGSGVAVPAALVLSGANANGAGSITASCINARDNAGNVSPPVSVTYQVTCSPVTTYSGIASVKVNQLAPYRPAVTATVSLDAATCAVTNVSLVSSANTTGALRFDTSTNWKPPIQPAAGQWKFAMKTVNAATGGVFINGSYRALYGSSSLLVKFVNGRLELYFKLTGQAPNGVGITKVGIEAEASLPLTP